ncbi:PD-(D/E)XK nuclease family protein [Dactylosporangium sp. NPDC006015]|uniref:PD-(D/E)XK nuclease family protein n=1 Tax=Dactylosporangium sp. NPDC006015 TaxID=3154576 RepID=UPI00339EC796
MPAWQPEGFSLSPENLFKISASDVDNDQLCPQHGFVKSRSGTSILGTHGWRKTYDPEDFPLKRFLIALSRYHARRTQGDSHDPAFVKAEDAYRDCHPGLLSYLGKALENYLDFLDARQSLAGEPLVYLGYDHSARVTPKGAIAAWAPIYRTATGKVEIHRIRERKIDPQVSNWDIMAGHLGASMAAGYVRSVNVIEVLLYRGRGGTGEAVKFQDADPRMLADFYGEKVRPRALQIVAGGAPQPGRDCASCRVTAVCNSLIPMDGALHQYETGPYTRSVSATDLAIYERCPARWYLERKLRLPVDVNSYSNPSLNRGRLVHGWLREAHKRGVACTHQDVPDVADRLSSDIAGNLTNEEYESILPFLRSHLSRCPLLAAIEVLHTESAVYGWDQTADTIIASAPDIVYLDSDVLVIRETKTTDSALPAGGNEAREMFDGVVYWLLNLAEHGWVASYGASSGVVELEVLTPSASGVFRYSTDDMSLMVVAETRVKHTVEGWHEDTSWPSRPTEHCRTCPVALWCPDSENYITTPAARGAPMGGGLF